MSTKFGEIVIIWDKISSKSLVNRIFLSDDQSSAIVKTTNNSLKSQISSNPIIDSLIISIEKYLSGQNPKFDLGIVDFSQCYTIQEKIIRAEYEIPVGHVSTYKRIAEYVGISNGARVVGNALAKNPFPIIIPCHRAIRSEGSLGGYQGGLEMKRELLEMEGIEFINFNKVKMDRVYY